MLCDEIRRLRLAKRITQARLADRLGVSKQSVSNWENNNIQPSVELLEKLADYFAVSTDTRLGRHPDTVIDASGLTAGQTAHVRQLIQDLQEANQGRSC